MLLRFCEGWKIICMGEIVKNTQGKGECITMSSKGGWLSRGKQSQIKTETWTCGAK
jgi:hypothetical protein